jgi:LuxR family quorum sensing-dependent transcriptional regulator
MDFAHLAFDCISSLERAKTPSEVIILVSRAAQQFGLEHFMRGGIPAPSRSLAPYVLMHNWPSEWVQRYTDEAYPDLDPVMQRLRSSTMPFTWREAAYDADKNRLAHRVMMEATDFGLITGFSVPIYTTSGDQAAVTFGGRTFDDTPDARRTLHLIAIYGHNKAREISLALNKNVSRELVPKLSPRELEILKWCSVGKTNSAIAELLSLTENTVETYVAKACRKLDCVNRTQAVAEAIRARLIC